MNRPKVAATTAPRPSRILVILAVAWLIAAMTIGGFTLEAAASGAAATTTTTSNATQP